MLSFSFFFLFSFQLFRDYLTEKNGALKINNYFLIFPNRKFRNNIMTEKLQGPTPGVRLRELLPRLTQVNVKRKLMYFLQRFWSSSIIMSVRNPR